MSVAEVSSRSHPGSQVLDLRRRLNGLHRRLERLRGRLRGRLRVWQFLLGRRLGQGALNAAPVLLLGFLFAWRSRRSSASPRDCKNK